MYYLKTVEDTGNPYSSIRWNPHRVFNRNMLVLQTGDEHAFDRVIARHNNGLFYLIRAMVREEANRFWKH